MTVKFVVLAALVAVAHSSVVPIVRVDADSSHFSYEVANPNTGDFKSQAETRVGSNVVGQYSLLDADGTRRTVDYTADDANGFKAIVRKDPVVPIAPVVPAVPAETVSPVESTASADSSSFSYNVADPSTGDFKSQVETRVGSNIVGQYSLLDADGTKRTVDYTANDANGFNAIVRKDPAVPVVSVVPVEPESPVGPAITAEPISSVEPANSVKSASPVGPAVTAEPITSVEPANSGKSASPVKPVASVAPVTFVVSSEPSVVDYRNYAHIFYAGGPVTTVYSSIVAPSPYSAFVPSVYGVPAAFAGPLAYW